MGGSEMLHRRWEGSGGSNGAAAGASISGSACARARGRGSSVVVKGSAADALTVLK
jgi:hypothetical protein